ncbi:hypothetical protein WG29040_23180 [Pseudomonas sp. PAMC 29040]|uniref:hypothetical protein n=1 Tax=Pseudomonas sp. PAMC 29040 TaxID=2498450 RepID=UPI000F9A217E|nr:hypothetical protein [Pseudomonas sp. PAMC 29040]RUT30845.1 hypothetical protein WG29040_23180 [Pseudomonas sp. PAMC 29040]
MILKAYRDARFHYMNAREFAAFKADNKYLVGVTAGGREWLLQEGLTLKAIEALLPDMVRLNRGVLVKRALLTEIIRVRVGSNIAITVVTTVGNYTLARRNCVKTIVEIIEHNLRRKKARIYPLESPE